MSPEQVRGEPIDGRSDLFGLGAMLYEMLTGAPPFQGDSIASISYKLVHVEPTRFEEAGRDVPPQLEAVVRRALEKEPAHRFQSGDELAAALEQACRLAGEESPPPTPAPPPVSPAMAGAPTRATAARPRFPWTPLRVAVAGLALAGFVGLGYRAGLPSPRAVPRSASPPPQGAPTPAVAREPAPRAPVVAPPAPLEPARAATLHLLYYNRLRRGAITVWVDGERVWTSPLGAPRRLLDRVEWEPVRASLPVASGKHLVEVHVSQIATGIESRGSIRGDFAPGGTRLLRVTLVPLVPALGLEWEP
jgi:hypothetical protein